MQTVYVLYIFDEPPDEGLGEFEGIFSSFAEAQEYITRSQDEDYTSDVLDWTWVSHPNKDADGFTSFYISREMEDGAVFAVREVELNTGSFEMLVHWCVREKMMPRDLPSCRSHSEGHDCPLSELLVKHRDSPLSAV